MARIILLAMLLGLSVSSQASSEKIVYHLHTNNSSLFVISINNLENLIQGMGNDPIDIRLLLQGGGIHLLNPASVSETLALRLENLLTKGVTIETSKTNYQQNEFFLDNRAAPHLVDNIFSRAIELQRQGYRYITP